MRAPSRIEVHGGGGLIGLALLGDDGGWWWRCSGIACIDTEHRVDRDGNKMDDLEAVAELIGHVDGHLRLATVVPIRGSVL